ncbi:MAG: 3-hydroxyacyl-CoA dehydrogenase NAD-binding domain-containing protein [Cytophagales bacterium]
MTDIKKVVVVGSGTMGVGIAHSFAQHGFEVVLCDMNEKALENGIEVIKQNFQRQVNKGLFSDSEMNASLLRISTNIDLINSLSGADLLVEAIFEEKVAKTRLFETVSEIKIKSLIVASNTSSIPIEVLAEAYIFPEQFVGMHFFNPVPMMPLVELVRTSKTSDEVLNAIFKMAEKLGKRAILVNDFPGFVSNRVLMPMINEAILALEQGVADVSGIDHVMMLGMSHPMGPLKLADFIGLDVCLMIMRVLEERLGEKYKPADLLVKLVDSKLMGVKTGEGFYVWEGKNASPKTDFKF